MAWEHTDLTTMPPPAGTFDLVSVQYFPLSREPDHTALRGLLDAVAPGGTLLFVSHDLADLTPRPDFDPSDYYQPDDIATVLDDDWTVVINETRPRTAPAPAGTHHTNDTVLRAQRRLAERAVDTGAPSPSASAWVPAAALTRPAAASRSAVAAGGGLAVGAGVAAGSGVAAGGGVAVGVGARAAAASSRGPAFLAQPAVGRELLLARGHRGLLLRRRGAIEGGLDVRLGQVGLTQLVRAGYAGPRRRRRLDARLAGGFRARGGTATASASRRRAAPARPRAS